VEHALCSLADQPRLSFVRGDAARQIAERPRLGPITDLYEVLELERDAMQAVKMPDNDGIDPMPAYPR